MKHLLLGALALLSANAFSQSYIVLNSGVALTTDTKGFVYDFHHFVLPNNVKGKGGNFIIEDKQLVTIDENGYLYRNDTKVKKLQGQGLNYFIAEGAFGSRKLWTVDVKGFAYEMETEGLKLKDIKKFGGNYFVLDGNLGILRNDGTYKLSSLTGLDLEQIKHYPGKYFVAASGQFFAVSDEGEIKTSSMLVGEITKSGGNFFINESGSIYTVSSDGVLKLPSLPNGLIIKNIKSVGANYMIDNAGQIFTVDNNGVINQRFTELDISRTRVIGL